MTQPPRVTGDTVPEVSAAWAAQLELTPERVVVHGDRAVLGGTSRVAVVRIADGHALFASDKGCKFRVAPDGLSAFGRCGKEARRLEVLDPLAGKTIESHELDASIEDAVRTASGTLLATVEIAGEKPTHELRVLGVKKPWRTSLVSEPAPTAELLIETDGQRYYAYEADPFIWALDPRSGKQLWKRPFAGYILGLEPRGEDLVVRHQHGLDTLDAATGRAKSRLALGGAAIGTLDGLVFVHTSDGADSPRRFEARDMNGNKRWHTPAKLGAITGASVGADAVYACSEEGLLHAFDPKSGRRLWWASVGSAESCAVPFRPPGASHEWVLVTNDDSTYAFDPGRPAVARTVVVTGTVESEFETTGTVVAIGSRRVRTDRRGRFWATVKTAGPAVRVRLLSPTGDSSPIEVDLTDPDIRRFAVELSDYEENTCH